MNFWKKFEEFRKQVNNVESNIYSSKQDFLEVYEKNLRLEAEIEERTQELQLDIVSFFFHLVILTDVCLPYNIYGK